MTIFYIIFIWLLFYSFIYTVGYQFFITSIIIFFNKWQCFKKYFPFWCLYTFFVTISILGREFLWYPSWCMSYIFSPLASQIEMITFYVGYCWFTGTCFRELLVKILESLGNLLFLLELAVGDIPVVHHSRGCLTAELPHYEFLDLEN